MFEPVETEAVAEDTGPRRLLAAVLLDAVAQLHERGSKAAVEAERWIRAPHASWARFSFAMVCESLGLDAAYLARGLLNGQPSVAAPPRCPRRRTVAIDRYRRIVLSKPRRRRRPQRRLSNLVANRSPNGV